MLARFFAVVTREWVDQDDLAGTVVHLDLARLGRVFYDLDERRARWAGGPSADARREHGMGCIGDRLRTGEAGRDLARR